MLLNSRQSCSFIALLLTVALGMGGCAGKGMGLDANGRPLSEGGLTNSALTADFASIQDHIFTPICTICHVGGSAPMGLRLDSANSYNLLVGIPSTEEPSILRVKPGDPDNSYIIQKLEGHAKDGGRMPLNLPPLSTDQIAAIRQWITDGAQRSAAVAVGTSFMMTATVPSANEVLSAAPPQIIVGFNHELDATQINEQSAQLERQIDNGVDATFEPVTATLSLPTATPMSLVLTPTQALSDGHYRLVIPTTATTISDNAGIPLGTPMLTETGDALIVEFDVETQR